MENEHSKEATDFTLKVANDDIAELKRRQTEQVNLGNEILGMSDVMDTWQETLLGMFLTIQRCTIIGYYVDDYYGHLKWRLKTMKLGFGKQRNFIGKMMTIYLIMSEKLVRY